MTDPDHVAIPGDDGSALMSVALVDALDGRQATMTSRRRLAIESYFSD